MIICFNLYNNIKFKNEKICIRNVFVITKKTYPFYNSRSKKVNIFKIFIISSMYGTKLLIYLSPRN